MWGALLALAAAGGAAYLLLRSGKAEAAPTVAELQREEQAAGFDWPTVFRIVGTVGERSSDYGALNRNDRGNGVSFGLIQHNQASGSLGRMLDTWRHTDPAGFAGVWGDLGDAMVASLTSPDRAERMRLRLAEEPYLSRWALAGRAPGCQAAQAYEARVSYLNRRIMEAAAAHGLAGTRAIGLIFDRSINQGPGVALQALGRIQALPAEGMNAALIDFMNACLDLAGPDAAAVQRRLERVDAALQASGVS